MTARHIDDHLKQVADISEITALLSESPDIQGFLNRAVIMVAEHLAADVCSIYLFGDSTRQLVLSATRGLAPEAVGRVQLGMGEGLVGKAMKELRPICMANASKSPDYKYFPEAGEDPYDAFLAVPILRGIEKIGVLVVQRDEKHLFNNSEVMAMRALTAQLASAIETVRAMRQVAHPVAAPQPDMSEELFVGGHFASPGYAFAPSVVYARLPVRGILKQNSAAGTGAGDRADLERALDETGKQLERLQTEVGATLPEVASLIFESHMMMLKDDTFKGAMIAKMEEGIPARRAVAEVASDYMATFESSTHDYLREKAHDIGDLALRLLANLSGDVEAPEQHWNGRVLIVHQLLPSDILKVTLANVAGIVQVGGGLTAHVSLLLRSLGIPMVIANDVRLMRVASGTNVLLDADVGNVYVNPSEAVTERFQKREKVRETVDVQKGRMADRTVMQDGEPVTLLANINLLSELDLALDLKAEGVGLYRTEFPFLVRQTLPSENDQVAVYARLFERMRGHDVTIRTLDAGGDKVLACFDDAGEPNPAMGLRSTRLTLRHSDVFDQQLRAILRAANDVEQLRIMFPMIASLDEFTMARDRVLRCAVELEQEGISAARNPMIGMMVELPAVLEIIDAFAREADFFSIGTNDFIQYMLAVDRTNERVAEYYRPHHPSVLRGLKRIADAALQAGINCAVCGEMAHDTHFVPFFLGIGIRHLSVDPHYLSAVQACVMDWSSQAAEGYAGRLLSKCTIAEIEPLLTETPV